MEDVTMQEVREKLRTRDVLYKAFYDVIEDNLRSTITQLEQKYQKQYEAFEKSHTATVKLSESGRAIDEYIDLLMKGFNELQYEWHTKLCRRRFYNVILPIVALIISLIAVLK